MVHNAVSKVEARVKITGMWAFVKRLTVLLTTVLEVDNGQVKARAFCY
jgi:hypothetical protein